MYKQKEEPNFYIITGFIDFRCGIDSLCCLLKGITNINPISNSAFIFMNKTKDKLKILYWGGDGFWLLSHRLEESKYIRIKDENHIMTITKKQLEWLLDGLEINPKGYHNEVKNKEILY